MCLGSATVVPAGASNVSSGRSVERPVAAHDACNTFQNETMLVLVLMMHQRAVVGMRDHRAEALSRPRLQPLALVHRAGSMGFGCHCCCTFLSGLRAGR